MQNAAFSDPKFNVYKKPLTQIKISYQEHIELSLPPKKSAQVVSFLKISPSSLNRERALESEAMDVKAKGCLTEIKDPLWQRICQEILDMMGPASFFKLWKSQLGSITAQDKVLNITCENEETTAFVQRFDFVILGCIQKYFPALKHVRAETMNKLAL